ncbi:unnamed protein product [Trichogramma brassicae]|uniref:Uncharacterized protein n=1 Tax=Trichogramma brassicae TaxID=86971 RepID=A0A6H5IJN8_9HYME|nr:unnamed protein product [Trichogramma brassicae]
MRVIYLYFYVLPINSRSICSRATFVVYIFYVMYRYLRCITHRQQAYHIFRGRERERERKKYTQTRSLDGRAAAAAAAARKKEREERRRRRRRDMCAPMNLTMKTQRKLARRSPPRDLREIGRRHTFFSLRKVLLGLGASPIWHTRKYNTGWQCCAAIVRRARRGWRRQRDVIVVAAAAAAAVAQNFQAAPLRPCCSSTPCNPPPFENAARAPGEYDKSTVITVSICALTPAHDTCSTTHHTLLYVLLLLLLLLLMDVCECVYAYVYALFKSYTPYIRLVTTTMLLRPRPKRRRTREKKPQRQQQHQQQQRVGGRVEQPHLRRELMRTAEICIYIIIGANGGELATRPSTQSRRKAPQGPPPPPKAKGWRRRQQQQRRGGGNGGSSSSSSSSNSAVTTLGSTYSGSSSSYKARQSEKDRGRESERDRSVWCCALQEQQQQPATQGEARSEPREDEAALYSAPDCADKIQPREKREGASETDRKHGSCARSSRRNMCTDSMSLPDFISTNCQPLRSETMARRATAAARRGSQRLYAFEAWQCAGLTALLALLAYIPVAAAKAAARAREKDGGVGGGGNSSSGSNGVGGSDASSSSVSGSQERAAAAEYSIDASQNIATCLGWRCCCCSTDAAAATTTTTTTTTTITIVVVVVVVFFFFFFFLARAVLRCRTSGRRRFSYTIAVCTCIIYSVHAYILAASATRNCADELAEYITTAAASATNERQQQQKQKQHAADAWIIIDIISSLCSVESLTRKLFSVIYRVKALCEDRQSRAYTCTISDRERRLTAISIAQQLCAVQNRNVYTTEAQLIFDKPYTLLYALCVKKTSCEEQQRQRPARDAPHAPRVLAGRNCSERKKAHAPRVTVSSRGSRHLAQLAATTFNNKKKNLPQKARASAGTRSSFHIYYKYIPLAGEACRQIIHSLQQRQQHQRAYSAAKSPARRVGAYCCRCALYEASTRCTTIVRRDIQTNNIIVRQIFQCRMSNDFTTHTRKTIFNLCVCCCCCCCCSASRTSTLALDSRRSVGCRDIAHESYTRLYVVRHVAREGKKAEEKKSVEREKRKATCSLRKLRAQLRNKPAAAFSARLIELLRRYQRTTMYTTTRSGVYNDSSPYRSLVCILGRFEARRILCKEEQQQQRQIRVVACTYCASSKIMRGAKFSSIAHTVLCMKTRTCTLAHEEEIGGHDTALITAAHNTTANRRKIYGSCCSNSIGLASSDQQESDEAQSHGRSAHSRERVSIVMRAEQFVEASPAKVASMNHAFHFPLLNAFYLKSRKHY